MRVVVAGLGAVGGAALYQLARRGVDAVGIDRFAPPHTHGSSHGESRITRCGVGEGAAYVPLALRSQAILRAMEAESGAQLMMLTGGLVISRDAAVGGRKNRFFAATVEAAARFGIAHERLDAAALRRRFPQFVLDDAEYGYFEPSAGVIRPEAVVATQLALAARHGAAVHAGTQMTGFGPACGGVEVRTEHGVLAADALILAVGKWVRAALPEASGRFRLCRQVMAWFAADEAAFAPGRFGVFIREIPGHADIVYGFPNLSPGGGVKIATEQYAQSCAAEGPDAAGEVSAAETAALYDLAVRPWLRGVGPAVLRAACCTYTVTPNSAFVIDRHPAMDQVWVASACSGHGFKHAAAVGEALADLVTGRKPAVDLRPFRWAA